MANSGRNLSYQTLEAMLLSRPFTLDGHSLSKGDCERVSNALALWLLVIADLAESYSLGRCYSLANLQRCASRLSGCDVGLLHSQLKQLLELLRLWQPQQGCQSFRAYKAWFNQALTPDAKTWDLLWPMLARGYPEYKPSWFRDMNTILQFWSRLTLIDIDWIMDENLDAYLTLEQEMREWVYPSSLVSDLKEIVNVWCANKPSFDGIIPHHSNGATCEVPRGKGKERKYDVLRPTWAGRYLLAKTVGFSDHPLICEETVSRASLRAKVEFVPKGINKKRVISEESTYNQYCQSVYSAAMARWFDNNPSMNIHLDNQDYSRQLCLHGSRYMNYATIDLSSASDTVTYRLVKELIRGTWLQPMLLARTPYAVLPDGSEIALEKFAPMGSVLCFPMECLVFSACCRLACDRTGCTPNYLVYGDDMIIPEAAVSALLSILAELHFIVNEDKSYGPYSCFLEACGMEAYLGFDVSPCRLPRRWDITKLRAGHSPELLEGSISLCNRLYDYGLYKARRATIGETLRVFPNVPFSVDPERGFYHPDPGNAHLQRRYNRNLQKCEVKCVLPKARVQDGRDDSRYQIVLEEYCQTRRRALMDPMDLIEVRSGPTRVTFNYAWRDLLDFEHLRPTGVSQARSVR